MISVQHCHKSCLPSACVFENNVTKPETTSCRSLKVGESNRRKIVKCRSINNGGEAEKESERRSFLTLEEAGLVEISGLSTHERFLCRLTNLRALLSYFTSIKFVAIESRMSNKNWKLCGGDGERERERRRKGKYILEEMKKEDKWREKQARNKPCYLHCIHNNSWNWKLIQEIYGRVK
ncbi:uncharacterized protein LOC129285213 isoform X2 [Prosopis cineraria]|uniref:uncharacterized protein LOC129285213 isoform X2 n=1 Tax=Prosopis cineraria TaxID=364024 RepID=UPI00240EF5C1|nr:uncharacterized protein LOC129285213 isoform X2 [Prosopis cineraria]